MRREKDKAGTSLVPKNAEPQALAFYNKARGTEETFRASATLVGNLLPSLGMGQDVKVKIYSNKKDAPPPAFSSFEQKVILCLEKLLYKAITFGEKEQQESAQRAIELLTIDRLDRRGDNYVRWGNYTHEDSTLAGRPPVVVEVPLRELAQELYNIKPKDLGGKQYGQVKEALRSISDRWYLWQFTGKTEDGRRLGLKIESRLIDVVFKAPLEDDGETQYAEIQYKDMWLYQLNSKYVLTPCSILPLLKDTSRTALFLSLFQMLRYERGFRVDGAHGIKAIEKKFRKEHAELSEEDKRELEQVKTKTLTYTKTLSSLCENIRSYQFKDKNGETGIRKGRAKKDLEKAVEDLKQIGLIKDFYAIEGGKEVTCYFVLNELWIGGKEGIE